MKKKFKKNEKKFNEVIKQLFNLLKLMGAQNCTVKVRGMTGMVMIFIIYSSNYLLLMEMFLWKSWPYHKSVHWKRWFFFVWISSGAKFESKLNVELIVEMWKYTFFLSVIHLNLIYFAWNYTRLFENMYANMSVTYGGGHWNASSI